MRARGPSLKEPLPPLPLLLLLLLPLLLLLLLLLLLSQCMQLSPLQIPRFLFFLDPLVLQCPVGDFRLFQIFPAPLLHPRALFTRHLRPQACLPLFRIRGSSAALIHHPESRIT